MKRLAWFFLAAAMLPLSASAQNSDQDRRQREIWNRPFEPFTMIGNVHFVGTRGLGAYLITDPAGHILIDGGLPESAPLIARNIEALGFRLRDVKVILINHAHYDHAGGLAELKKRTGAKLWASAGDRADLESGAVAGRPELATVAPVAVDRTIKDQTVLKLGANVLTANLTPGHTRGCTSWSMRTAGVRILFTCSLTVGGQNLIDDPTYPSAAADFRRTFARLKGMHADMFVNFHPDLYDLEGKRARQLQGDKRAFVDPTELQRQVAVAERAFDVELANQKAAKR